MALQIFNKNPQSFGEAFGESLQRIGQRKVQQIEERNRLQNASQRLQNLDQRITPGIADYLATLPPKEQWSALQAFGAGNQPAPQQQQAQDPYMQQLDQLVNMARAQGHDFPEITGTMQPQQPMPQTQQEQPSFLQAVGKGTAKATTIDQKKQGQINSANKKYNELFDKRRLNADRETEIADEALKLLDTNNVASGAWGLLPEVFKNSETQQFDSAVNELATILAERGGGPGSKYRTQLAQQIKASSSKTPEAQRALLERVKRQAQKVFLEEDIRNKLIEENNGEQPANFSDMVSKRLKQYESKGLNSITEQEESILPYPFNYKEKDIIEDEDTGIKYQLMNGEWYRKG